MLFESYLDYYQEIANELCSIYTKPWSQVRVGVERGASAINLQVVYYDGVGGEDSDVNFRMLGAYFYEVTYMLSTEDLGLYKKGVFIMDSEGEYSANYEY